MLGLADQVGGDVVRVGGVVGEDGDLGRAGLGVDADAALQQPLGRGDPDRPGAGDHRNRLADSGLAVDGLLEAVREHGDRLGAAHGIHLGDAEQGARGEDGRVGIAGEAADVLLLRGARDGQRADLASCAGTTFMTTLEG